MSDEVNEALAKLIREGLVKVEINEDGEQVFRLTERGYQEAENEES